MQNANHYNPYEVALREAVEHAYETFAHYHISGGLEVCMCNVCMDEQTRQDIIKTPVQDMPVRLIQEYSNSAHGVPFNTDDLKAILPRYLDLIAQNESVDYVNVDTELRRFGDAIRENQSLFSPSEQEAYHKWAKAMFQAQIWDTLYDDVYFSTPENLAYMLLVGGVPISLVISWWEDMLDHDLYGDCALVELCRYLLNNSKWKGHESYDLKVYALEWTNQDTIDQFYAWLNAPNWQARLIEVDFDKVSDEDELILSQMMDVFGKFDPTATQLYPHRCNA